MSSGIEDLWPADIAPVVEAVPPITILKQQASILGQRTKNIVEAEAETHVEAEVETKTEDYQRFLRHTLFLVAPALNFYRYPLLDVVHHVTQMYPVTIEVAWLEKDEDIIQAANEQEFKDGLKRIFADEETKRVIGALLAQSVEKKTPR